MHGRSLPLPPAVQARVFGMAFTLSPVVYGVVLAILSGTGALPATGFARMAPGAAQMVAVGAVVGAAALVVVSFLVRRVLPRRAPEAQVAMSPGWIVAMAVCEAAGIAGLLAGMLSGQIVAAGLCIAASVIGCYVHMLLGSGA